MIRANDTPPLNDGVAEGSLLGYYIDVLRRRGWIVICTLIVVAAVAAAYSFHQTKLYQSGTNVYLVQSNLVDAVSGVSQPNPEPGQLQRNGDNQAELADSRPVALDAIHRLSLRGVTARDFLNDADVTPQSSTDFLTFSVTRRSATQAVRWSTAFAQAYVAYRSRLDTASLRVASAEISRQIQAAGNSSSLIRSLQTKRQELQTLLALQTSNATVVPEPATATLVQPKRSEDIGLGIVVGILLGAILAGALEALDRTITDGDRAERLYGFSPLVRIPTAERSVVRQARLEPILLSSPQSAVAEAFRILRAAVAVQSGREGLGTILITSADAGEGKSTVAANLALAFAQAGNSVVLIDADLRRPAVARVFNLKNGPGLANVLAGQFTVDECLVRPPSASDGEGSSRLRGDLQILPAGDVAGSDAAGLLESGEVALVLAGLKARADVVILDTAPAVQVSDTMVLAALVDGQIAVTRVNVATPRGVRALLTNLSASDTPLLGYVLNASGREAGYSYPYGASAPTADKT